MYSNRLREIIDEHPIEDPMFLYVPLQTVHAPLEVPQVYNVSEIDMRHYYFSQKGLIN